MKSRPSTSRVLLVSGGSRGIGAAVCRLAAERGYDLVVGHRDSAEEAAGVVRAVEAAGQTGLAVAADVSQPDRVAELFRRCDEAFGRLDALVCCAGVTGRASALASAEAPVMQHTLDVNVMGTLLCCREATRRMAKSRGGSGGAIVTLSSGAATLGSAGEFVWYAASKGAVDSLTIGLSKELANEGIRVNAVSPGLSETELHARSTGEPGRVARMAPSIPLGRAARPEEIAEPVLWLLSDAASYTTGAILRVAGGR